MHAQSLDWLHVLLLFFPTLDKLFLVPWRFCQCEHTETSQLASYNHARDVDVGIWSFAVNPGTLGQLKLYSLVPVKFGPGCRGATLLATSQWIIKLILKHHFKGEKLKDKKKKRSYSPMWTNIGWIKCNTQRKKLEEVSNSVVLHWVLQDIVLYHLDPFWLCRKVSALDRIIV